jgi:hypothetical protein
MTDQPLKVSQLPQASNVAPTDRLLVLYNAANPESDSVRTVTINTIGSNLVLSNSAPANSSATGTKGNIRYDSNYIYVCVDTNTWVRAPIATW